MAARIRIISNEHTSTKEDTALWILIPRGGSNARDRTSSMEVPRLTFMILIRSARSLRLRRMISGSGWAAICVTVRSEAPPSCFYAKTYLGIMSRFGKEVETEATLYTTCTTASLRRIALGDERLDKSADLPLFVEPHFPVLSRINHAGDVRNSDTSLRDVRCCDKRQVCLLDQTWRHHAPMTIFLIPGGGMSKTAPC